MDDRRAISFAAATPQGSALTAETKEAPDLGHRTLYPPSEAFRNGSLQVDSIHTIYYELHGVPEETYSTFLTALFLHGGPGAGCFPNHARFFDPKRYRIVLMDQRGCGRSTPKGEVKNNTLGHLVSDCESLRRELGFDKWDVVLGGSWGSTLAVAYAQSHPQSVGALVLRGVCTMRQAEVDWLFSAKGGAAALNPEGWRAFEEAVVIVNETKSERAALYEYYDRLLGSDTTARFNSARSWFAWEMRMSSLANSNQTSNSSLTQQEMLWGVDPSAVLEYNGSAGWSLNDNHGSLLSSNEALDEHEVDLKLRKFSSSGSVVASRDHVRPVEPVKKPETSEQVNNINITEMAKFVPAQSMLTCFYSVNRRYCMSNVDLLSEERMQRILHIPCIGVQGGMDVICPVDTALDMHRVWPTMELRIPLSAGHSMYDPAVTHQLIMATDRFAKRY